jgi:DNA-binding NarL/FixJ family response regulator
MASGITVELAIEDELLADRIEAMLQELGVDVAELDDNAALAISDIVPLPEAARTTILIADDIDSIAALRAGFAGLLPPTAEVADLRLALDAALRGLAVVPFGMNDVAEHRAVGLSEDPEAADLRRLTARETEVLCLLAEGASNKMVARKLGISVHTAKFHVASILEKLDATGRTDAVAHAVRLGLLML